MQAEAVVLLLSSQKLRLRARKSQVGDGEHRKQVRPDVCDRALPIGADG